MGGFMYTLPEGLSPENDCIIAKKALDMAVEERDQNGVMKFNEFYLNKAAAHLQRAMNTDPGVRFRYDGDEYTGVSMVAFSLYLEALNVQIHDKVLRGDDSLLSMLPFRKKNPVLEMVKTMESIGQTDHPSYQRYLTCLVSPENLEQAHKIMSMVLDLDDNNAGYHIEMARICQAMQKRDDARKHYDRAIALDNRPSYIEEAMIGR